MRALTRPGTMPARALPVVAVVVTAAISIAASFAISAGYSLHEVSADARPFASTVQRDVGAIAQLTVLRADLQHIGHLLAESTEGHPWEPGAMRRMLESIDQETAFVRTAYPDDVDPRLRAAAFDAITQARAGVHGMRTMLDLGNVEAARQEMHASLRPQLRHADSAIAMLLQSSMDELSVAVASHSRARERATRIALVLDALCVAIAFAFGAFAVRAVRREHRRLQAHVAELQVFADRVAHDIRGPLTPIQLALTEASRAATQPTRSFLDRGLRSMRVVTEIVDGLHAFARSQTGSRPDAHASLREVVENVIAESMTEAEQGDVQLAILGIEDVDVACEPGVLASIVSNLVRNAIRYMDRSSVRRVTISAHAGERCAAIVVQDTGPGMPPGFEERAFLPYARGEGSRRLGLGLGLATVKRLVDAHGGCVKVKSTPQGCTFIVELLLADRALDAPRTELAHGE